ncbi:homoserine kinase [Pseudoneobacillus sp. C159]
MVCNSFVIKVPASSANLGPGFDSIGLAIGLYLTLEVTPSSSWEITSASPELCHFPTNQSHPIFQMAEEVSFRFNKSLPPCKINMDSEIPLAKGLGSSAAAIVAAIELANHACELNLSKQEKLKLAMEFEGHPDNVGASLYGGLVIGSCLENEVELLSYYKLGFELVAYIPDETLLTTESRQVLPAVLSFKEAVEASSIANVLVASLLSGNWQLAGKMMEKDLFHQPYRRSLIGVYGEFERVAKANGAFGVALSGAGPTVLAFVEKSHRSLLVSKLSKVFSDKKIRHLEIDFWGSMVK